MINKKDYSNKLFKKWLVKSGISESEYKAAYNIYRAIRDDKKVSGQIKVSVVESLLNMLVKEINVLKVKLYGK